MSVASVVRPPVPARGDRDTRDDRARAALHALRQAELRTGVRRSDLGSAAPGRPLLPSVGVPAHVPTEAEAGYGEAEGREHGRAGRADERLDERWGERLGEGALPVPPAVEHLLPGGVLRRGQVTAVTGSTTLLLTLIARASAGGAWVAAVGMPSLGLVAAAELGLDLERLALVPRPGADAALAAGALLDGMDVVVLGPGAALVDADRRRLAARARERGSVLVPATPWTGAHVTLAVTAIRWDGAAQGDGWLRHQHLEVSRTGRGAARPWRTTVALPLGARGTAAWGSAARRPSEAPGAPGAAPTVPDAAASGRAVPAPLRLVG